MRLLKLSLLLLALCVVAQPQGAPAQGGAVSVPPHSPNDLFSSVHSAGSPLPLLGRGIDGLLQIQFGEPMTRKQFKIDPGINLNARSSVNGNTCFKLRKYIFQPKEQTKNDGMRPLGDEMQMVGETDCTYANKVWPKSAEGEKPPQPDVGFHSTVLRQK